MKRIIVPILLLAFLLSGCSSLMDGAYHSVKPHLAEGSKLSDDVVTVSDYNELRDALVEMVTSGKQQSTIYFTGFGQEDVDQYMRTAIMHVFQNSAIGAYAVEEITYDSGIKGGAEAIAVDVTYLHGRSEILRIKKAADIESAKNQIAASLRNCDSTVVIKINNYIGMDVEQYVQEYVNANPHLCMELPQVSATVYPKQGSERVLEVFFTYQNTRTDLQMMQNTVTPIFSAAELYVMSSDEASQKYEQLFSFLMERFDYKLESSITPVYSLLRYGVGDSKAFAMVYSIMCQNADLECRVVSGTKDGEAYYWNLIRFGETDYHVDLLASSAAGEFIPMIPDEMTGYVWDYSMYS